MKIRQDWEQLGMTDECFDYFESMELLDLEDKDRENLSFTEEEFIKLKKLIILTRCGMEPNTIKKVQDGEQLLQDAIGETIEEMEGRLISIPGSLKVCGYIKSQQFELETMEEEECLTLIHSLEMQGERFFGIVPTGKEIMCDMFDSMWKWVFFFDFKRNRKKGKKKAVGILLLLCVIRGMSAQFGSGTGTFLEGFLYPFKLFAISAVIIGIPLLLKENHPKIAKVIINMVFGFFILFFGILALIILVCLLNIMFHFWY